jgi:hypothetical protein
MSAILAEMEGIFKLRGAYDSPAFISCQLVSWDARTGVKNSFIAGFDEIAAGRSSSVQEDKSCVSDFLYKLRSLG